jgi:hypothetical protein
MSKSYGQKRSSNVCPEFDYVRKTCMTYMECSYDDERRCEICVCSHEPHTVGGKYTSEQQ